ncbi:hypothetical protein PHSY_006830 [Pseudozyma hubeiensis SY62]|uniref:Uncharacterized protein n=1 Tax=Pseudozyma hubeiensis (strain SY62) TaxID=1305764 RepID=R9PM83_PSEHS|nr:hypothetical protein PHSY_006830 [Pseudozyma hubeiensis SY62]GAC99230.1 hypothetical protein PHSY_006830 [Pseudozyma hubeiensis SY62]
METDVEDDGFGCASKRRRTIGRCGSDATLLDGQAPKTQLETRLATALLCEQHKTLELILPLLFCKLLPLLIVPSPLAHYPT